MIRMFPHTLRVFLFSLVPFVVGQGCPGTSQLMPAESDWEIMNSGTTEDLWDIWGTGPDNVYAVGGNLSGTGKGQILHYDGSSWTTISFPETDCLKGLWGSDPYDIFAVGSPHAMTGITQGLHLYR